MASELEVNADADAELALLLNNCSTDSQCVICLHSKIDPVQLPCAHSVCRMCYDTLKLHSVEQCCPLCRVVPAPESTTSDFFEQQGRALQISGQCAFDNGAHEGTAATLWRGAEDAYRKSIAAEPTQVQTRALAHVGLGDVLQRKGDLIGAEKSFREVLRLMPDVPVVQTDVRFSLVGVLAMQNKIVESEELLKEVMQLHPGSGNAIKGAQGSAQGRVYRSLQARLVARV